MGSIPLFILALLAITPNSQAAVFSEKGVLELRGVYKECLAGDTADTKIICRGIFGPGCLKGSFCDYLGIIKETKTHFEFRNLNFEDFDHRPRSESPPPKGYVYTIGFAPFVTAGGNSTSSCKSKITLQDFKMFVYKFPGERRLKSNTDSTARLTWDEEEFQSAGGGRDTVGKSFWAQSCESRLRERNHIISQYKGRPITEYENAGMMINNEYIQFLISNYYDRYTEQEKFRIKDASIYRTTDDVLYTNFVNEDLPEAERVFQLPPDKSADKSSASHAFSSNSVHLTMAVMSAAVVGKSLM